jgi:hypothetical protein
MTVSKSQMRHFSAGILRNRDVLELLLRFGMTVLYFYQ